MALDPAGPWTKPNGQYLAFGICGRSIPGHLPPMDTENPLALTGQFTAFQKTQKQACFSFFSLHRIEQVQYKLPNMQGQLFRNCESHLNKIHGFWLISLLDMHYFYLVMINYMQKKIQTSDTITYIFKFSVSATKHHYYKIAIHFNRAHIYGPVETGSNAIRDGSPAPLVATWLPVLIFSKWNLTRETSKNSWDCPWYLEHNRPLLC